MSLIFHISFSLSSYLSPREKEQRHLSPDHKDSRDSNLCVYGSGAAAAHHLHPGTGQTASKKGEWDSRNIIIQPQNVGVEAANSFKFVQSQFEGVGT